MFRVTCSNRSFTGFFSTLSLSVSSLSLAALFVPGAVLAEGGSTDALTVHGYLTQAYAISSDAQVLGITTDGNTDYRTMALQFRYAMSDNDSVVVQLSHEDQGASPFDTLRDDIELDWAFYEHVFASGTSVRVGRVPIPFGIYNELRDVGTLLEFYRPPATMYFEGGFSNESVDGVVLSHRFTGSWPVSIDVYSGGWTRNDAGIPIGEVAEADVDDAYGVQLWLETPLDGLRVGAAAQTWDLSGGLVELRAGDEDPADVYLLSLDLDRERWYARAEWQRIETRASTAAELEYSAWYAQAGIRFGSWGVHALYERSALDGAGGILGAFSVDPWYDDVSLGVSYGISTSTVLKVEYHDVESALVEEFDLTLANPFATELFIASVSVSF